MRFPIAGQATRDTKDTARCRRWTGIGHDRLGKLDRLPRLGSDLDSDSRFDQFFDFGRPGFSRLRRRCLTGAHGTYQAVCGRSTVSPVRQGSSTPSLAQTMSAVASAMARSVVALPPAMVTKP